MPFAIFTAGWFLTIVCLDTRTGLRGEMILIWFAVTVIWLIAWHVVAARRAGGTREKDI